MRNSVKILAIFNVFFIFIFLQMERVDAYEVSKSNVDFKHSYTDANKKCLSSGTKIIENVAIHKDCWEWSYDRTVNYPSKNDCQLYEHCYNSGNSRCLITDSIGNCVNMQHEFACESWEYANLENRTIRTGFKEKKGMEGMVCKGIPCIDGNCIDKSYETNGKMMDSISKLYGASKMSPDKNGNFNLFEGLSMRCAKKVADYANCCSVGSDGWGRYLGARCSQDEKTLMEQRRKNLCVYVGSEKKERMGIHVLTKQHYCCFSNMIDKVIQVEGRKQLGKSFGSGSSPDCRGLTLKEIQSIDWDKVDYSEFIEDLRVKFVGSYKPPSSSDFKQTIEGSLDAIKGFDSDLTKAGTVESKDFDENHLNNFGGINTKQK